jgi:hypothetical protein
VRLPPPRIWALTPEQYVRSVESLLPGAAVSVEALTGAVAVQSGFSNEASRLAMTEPHVGQLLELAYRLASDSAADPGKLAPCLAQPAPTAACVRELVLGLTRGRSGAPSTPPRWTRWPCNTRARWRRGTRARPCASC